MFSFLVYMAFLCLKKCHLEVNKKRGHIIINMKSNVFPGSNKTTHFI